MGDGEVGLCRIDVDRSDVNLDFRRNFFQVKAADAVSAEAQAGFEFHGNPGGVLADTETEFFRIHDDVRPLFGGIGTDFEMDAQF